MNFGPINFNTIDGVYLVPQPYVQARASMGMLFSLRTSYTSKEYQRDQEYFGRVQVGASINFELQCVMGRGLSPTAVAMPDLTPAARIYSTVAPLRVRPMPVDNSTGSAVGIFRRSFQPGPIDSPGRYCVLFAWRVQGHPVSELAMFEVIPGGHPNGAVMTTCNFRQPGGTSFIAHQESGRVTRGLRPFLDPGD